MSDSKLPAKTFIKEKGLLNENCDKFFIISYPGGRSFDLALLLEEYYKERLFIEAYTFNLKNEHRS